MEIKFVLKDNHIEFPYNGKPQRLRVTGVLLDHKEQKNRSIFAIGQDTVIKILPFTPPTPKSALKHDTKEKEGLQAMDVDKKKGSGDQGHYEQIGGLSAQVKTVREMVEIPLHNPDVFTQFGTSRQSLLMHQYPTSHGMDENGC